MRERHNEWALTCNFLMMLEWDGSGSSVSSGRRRVVHQGFLLFSCDCGDSPYHISSLWLSLLLFLSRCVHGWVTHLLAFTPRAQKLNCSQGEHASEADVRNISPPFNPDFAVKKIISSITSHLGGATQLSCSSAVSHFDLIQTRTRKHEAGRFGRAAFVDFSTTFCTGEHFPRLWESTADKWFQYILMLKVLHYQGGNDV